MLTSEELADKIDALGIHGERGIEAFGLCIEFFILL